MVGTLAPLAAFCPTSELLHGLNQVQGWLKNTMQSIAGRPQAASMALYASPHISGSRRQGTLNPGFIWQMAYGAPTLVISIQCRLFTICQLQLLTRQLDCIRSSAGLLAMPSRASL